MWTRRPRLSGNTRQAYYKAQKSQVVQQEKDRLMIKKLKRLREEMPGVGTRKLQHLTVSYRKKHNIKIGRDKMHELLRKEDMLIRFRRRRTRTTYSDHSYVRYKNLIENLEVTAVNQLYVSDITAPRRPTYPWGSTLPTLTWLPIGRRACLLTQDRRLASARKLAC